MIGDNEVYEYLREKEGFLTKPTNIGDGKITLGSGLTDPKWAALYRQRGNKWSEEDNRRAVLEEVAKRRKWAAENVPNWNLLPEASQDSLLSYKYNYDFTPTNSPKLFKALETKNFQEAARQMDATSKDPKFQKGLAQRRKEEQEWFLSGFNNSLPSASTSQATSRPTIQAPTMQQNYVAQPDATRVYRPEYIPKVKNIPHTQHPVEKNFWGEWGRMPYKAEGGYLDTQDSWSKLSMKDKADMMKVAIKNGITTLPEIRQAYNEYADGGDTNPAMQGMIKSRMATAAHYGNPTARRMTNYDGRSYVWPGEYYYDNGIGEQKRGNVYVSSYDNLVTPQIQDNGKSLEFVDNVWTPENDYRSYLQSLKFQTPEEAQYFGEHYKEVAPMMSLYGDGGDIHIKPENRGKFTRLKERTGHSATWFKEHGTPAQKKMATFALNAAKWHGLGGNLYDGVTEQ